MFKHLKEWVSKRHMRDVVRSEAYALMNNKAFLVVKESLQEDLLQQWVSTKSEEKELREELKRKYAAIDSVMYELATLYELREDEEDDRQTS